MRNKKIINLIVLSLIIVFLLDTPPVSAHDVSITGGVHLASPSAIGNATDFLGPTAVGPLVFDAYKADDERENEKDDAGRAMRPSQNGPAHLSFRSSHQCQHAEHGNDTGCEKYQ